MFNHSLHSGLKITLAIAQFFGLFPVKGIFNKDASKLSFRLCSLHFLYSVSVWIGLVFIFYRTWTLTTFRDPNGTLSAISNSSLLISAFPAVIVYPLFLQVSSKWPGFVKTWQNVEKTLILQSYSKSTFRRMRQYTILFAFLRFVYVSNGFFITVVRVAQCVPLSSVEHFIHTVFYVRYPQVYTLTTPTHWKSLLLTFLEMADHFSWVLCDLLILNLAMLLEDKLKLFCDHLKSAKIKICLPEFWDQMRMEFCKLAYLCKITDSLIGPMILCTVTFETMRVVLSIYLMLTHSFTKLSYVYFFIAFASSLSVDVVTLKVVANIFEQGVEPIKSLQLIPSQIYFQETQRLYCQLRRSRMALTGCRFYIVSQSFILSIISTLITYEVLLVQFGGLKHETLSTSETSASNSTLDYCNWIRIYLLTRN